MNFKRLKFACYTTNIAMSAVVTLSPVLFMTFRSMYGISYSLLGLLVLINFFTQLTVDLIFSFFSHKFNIPKTIKLMPVIATLGFLLYALLPFLFPNAVYVGLVIGTVVFSAACGLAEVFISPIIAAIPSDDPDREMSKLHSIYAWGVVFVITFSSLFILFVGAKNWQILILLFAIIPFVSSIIFMFCQIPQMQIHEKASGLMQFFKNKWLWASVIGIFLGGAAECTMSQWSSSYLEQALGIPKIWGDLLGVAMFAVMLGLGRTLYAKFGSKISRILLLGAIGATICYLVAALTDIPIVGLLACAFTGFCVSMLWPGSLVIASEKFKNGGVFIFAIMAAGGDLGASVGPQLIGVVTDTVIASPDAFILAERLGLSPEMLGMKLGMLIAMLFPLCAIPIYICIKKNRKE